MQIAAGIRYEVTRFERLYSPLYPSPFKKGSSWGAALDFSNRALVQALKQPRWNVYYQTLLKPSKTTCMKVERAERLNVMYERIVQSL